jgi:hypothetical protein
MGEVSFTKKFRIKTAEQVRNYEIKKCLLHHQHRYVHTTLKVASLAA